MAKPSLVSGIQPSGKLHLGNYLGALKNFIDLQNSEKYECYFFIADYHSLTEDSSEESLEKRVFDLASNYLALGLDPKKSLVFIQSQVPASTELAWILNTLAPMSELERMTQFKDKTEKLSKKNSPNVGLFDYPVLMAADILLYNPTFVPVGDDQLQHLELTRALARKFNSKYGKVFAEPQPILTNVPRLMSLDDPTKKMSKSHPGGCLFIDENPESLRLKIKKAVTDSGTEIKYDPKKKPALSNLIMIYSALTTWNTKTVENRFKKTSYGDFKNRLAELIIRHFSEFQKTKKSMNRESVKKVFSAGSKKANEIASEKMTEIKKRVGLDF